MLEYIITFYITAFFSAVLEINISKRSHGILIVHLISMWLTIFGPTFTEENTLNFATHLLQPNMGSVGISVFLLLVAGVSAGMFYEGGFQKNSVSQYIFIGASTACLSLYVILVVVVMPVNVQKCECLYGYYGENCENSCFGDNNIICSGHGVCSVNGCFCDLRFQGNTCDSCINQYNYDTNCSACNQGYNLQSQCTSCTTGRDPSTNCQGCLEGYLKDEKYNNPEIGCTVCKAGYFRPSTDPRVGSYNAFLEYGEVCAPCKGNPICSGHGTCNDFLTPNTNGDFLYEGKNVLGLQADGQCVCEQGFYGETCIKGLGYTGNMESICNGNGYITTNYERKVSDVFEKFKGISCVCNEGWTPSTTDDACSCFENSAGECVDCAFGYFLKNNKCVQCPGGSFTDACNQKNGGGVCQQDGTCKCRLSYASGGYAGPNCTECANNNFYKEGGTNRCVPCHDSFGPGFAESCNGHGVCITQNRLNAWKTNNDPQDSYDLYKFKTGNQAKTIEELSNLIGTCECFENYATNFFGTCF